MNSCEEDMSATQNMSREDHLNSFERGHQIVDSFNKEQFKEEKVANDSPSGVAIEESCNAASEEGTENSVNSWSSENNQGANCSVELQEEMDFFSGSIEPDLFAKQHQIGEEEIPTLLESMSISKDSIERKSHLAALIATEDQLILEKFLTDGGWAILFNWLEESKTNGDMPFVARLLDLYKILPVTVDMLKQNACAKTIKQLIKSPHEGISQCSKLIIDAWMLKVTLNKQKEKQSESGGHKSKKTKSLTKQKSIEAEVNSPSGVSEKTTPRKRSNSGSSDSLTADPATAISPEVKITVKILPPKPNANAGMGFMNALSQSTNSVPERRKRKIMQKKPSQQQQQNPNKNVNCSEVGQVRRSASNSIEDEDGDDGDDDDDEKTDVEDNLTGQPPVEPNEKRKKKSVTWADDDVGSLCSYFYFPMDETERVNVNHVTADFNEIRRHEIEMEHRMFQNSRRGAHCNSNSDDNHLWRRPSYLTGISYLVEPGCNSTEKKVQMMREQNVLQILYFNKHLLPDHPVEPDPEFPEVAEPKLIPLSDVTGTNSEVLYEHTGTAAVPSLSTAPSSSSSLLTSSSSSSSSSSTSPITQMLPVLSEVSSPVTLMMGQMQPNMAPAMAWGNMYPMPPPIMSPMMDQVMPGPNMMAHMMAPIYPPGFVPNPGFVHPHSRLPPPEILMGCMPPMARMPMPMPLPYPGGAKPLCSHFMTGNCKFGSNCRFFHPPSPVPPVIPGSITTTSNTVTSAASTIVNTNQPPAT